MEDGHDLGEEAPDDGEDKPAGDIALLDVFLALVVGVHGDM